MTSCPACGAQRPVDPAPFCGRCGALLVSPAGDRPTPSAPRSGGRRWLVGAVVLGLLGVALATRPWPGPPGSSEGDAATPTPVVAPLWQRSVGSALPLANDVVVAGRDHVLVGGRVLTTGTDAVPTRLRQLPAGLADSALAGDRWAVVEGGALVVGSVRAGVLRRIDLPAGLFVVGPARAWVDEDPVVADIDGHLVRLRGQGGPAEAVVWRTTRAVPDALVVGERWLLGRDAAGVGVAVAAADGALTELDGRPLAVLGDTAVLLRGEAVVGLDLLAGAERWERPDVGGTWRTVGGQLVLEGPVAVVRVDPVSGATTGAVARPAAVAVADGAVVVRDDELVALDWQGEVAWSRPLAAGATHRAVAVDATRVAVRSRTPEATTVTVVGAADGTVLGTAAALPVRLHPPAAGDGLVGIPLPGRGAPLVLDATTGAPVDRSTPPLRRDRIDTEAGPFVLDAGLVSIRAAGPLGGWRALLDDPVAATPIPLVASLYVTTTDGTVQRLDPARGTVRWQVRLDGLPLALAASGPEVLVGTADGRVVVLDDLGGVTRTIDVGTAVVAVAADRDVVVVVTADGRVSGYAG